MSKPLPSHKKIITVKNKYSDRDYCVKISIPEFTCVCPKTGQPDFATIEINYIPNILIVELKSLKLYLQGFRDVGVFHEIYGLIGNGRPAGHLNTLITHRIISIYVWI